MSTSPLACLRPAGFARIIDSPAYGELTSKLLHAVG